MSAENGSILKTENLSPFWDKDINKLKLGDFKELVNFLVLSSGFRDKIENQIK